MLIKLEDIGKRYNYEWIFRHVNEEIIPGEKCVITGSNGSGKSTLLQVIFGNISYSEGKVSYLNGKDEIKDEHIYKQFSIATPYLELPEEFTLKEAIVFHSGFKPFLPGFDASEVIECIGLNSSANKEIRYFSSGMKQRVRLAFAILCNTPAIFLDEPTTNLDRAGVTLYKNLIENYAFDRTVIVCSNMVEEEYFFCTKHISIEDFKKK